jgi:hypothetical protein
VPRPRTVFALHAAVGAAVLVAACTAGHVKAGPLPNFDEATTTSTTVFDYSSVQIAAVPSHPSVTIPLGPGQATLNGTVTGPNGPVADADVHVERIVDGISGSTDVPTKPDGTWTLPNLLGGEFRIRAWLAPTLALTTPSLLFLAATDTQTVNLNLSLYNGLQVSASIAPNPPIIDEPANVVVEVTSSVVGPDGVVRAAPAAGQLVQLFSSGLWTIGSNVPETTDANGLAGWGVTCTGFGSTPLSVVVNSADVVPLTLASCAPVPTTTTIPPTSTTSRGGTTTTVRGRRTTTTGP